MPGTFLLMQVVLAMFSVASLIPSFIAVWKGRYGLASALAVVGLFVGLGPWLLMFGLARFIGDGASLLLYATLLFAPCASCVVLFLPRQRQTTPPEGSTDGPVAPWLAEMRAEAERKK